MNEHVEALVEVKPNGAMKALNMLLWFVCGVSVIAAFLGLFYTIAPLAVAIASGAGAYFVGLRVNTEYEYTLTDKDLDVDIIFSKERRKHITSLDLNKLEVAAPEGSYHLDEYKKRDCKTFDYSSKIPEDGKKLLVMYIDGARYLFEPDEELKSALYNVSPRKVFKD